MSPTSELLADLQVQYPNARFIRCVAQTDLESGDVVILDETAVEVDGVPPVTTTTSADHVQGLGVVAVGQEVVLSGTDVLVQVSGLHPAVKIDGTTDISHGDSVATFTTAGVGDKAAADAVRIGIYVDGDYSTDATTELKSVFLTNPLGLTPPAPSGGHPANPLGNNDFRMTAHVLRLIEDRERRRLFAIVRTEAGFASIYRADMGAMAPGFAPGSAPFPIDSERIPGVILHDGYLIVATGIAGEYKNVVYDPETSLTAVHATYTTPFHPPPPVAIDNGSGDINAIGTLSYRYCYFSSTTRARSQFSDPAEVGPLAERIVQVTMTGSHPATGEDIYDQIEIYRTTDGGPIWRYLDAISNPGGDATITYDDETPDDQLSLRTLPIRYGRPPTTRYALLHNDRALYAYRSQIPIDGSVVYYSEPFAPLNVDPVFNVVTVKPSDGAQIVGIFELYNRVYVIKSNGAVFELASNLPQSVFRVDPIIGKGPHACVSNATIVSMGNRAMWLTRIGVVAFDGETIQPVSFGVEPAFVDTQLTERALSEELPDETGDGGYIPLDFRNTDVMTERFYFALHFFRGIPVDPDDKEDPLFHESINSQTNPEYFKVLNATVDAAGVEIAPGDEIAIRCYPQTLIGGGTYYIYKQVRDTGGTVAWNIGGTTGGWLQLPEPYLFQPVLPGGLDLAWGVADKFHALDFWPRHELWVYTASRFSTELDTRWILDYQSLGGEEPPLWRRDTVHATAAILIDGLDMSSDQKNMAVAVFGDANGCMWMDHWPGLIDRLVEGITLEPIQRTIAFPPPPPYPTSSTYGARMAKHNDANGDYWTITRGPPYDPSTQSFPVTSSKMKGNAVTVRSVRGDTFSGIIVDNTERTIDVRFWLEGRAPPVDQALDVRIGGIDAHLDYYPTPLQGPEQMKEVRYMILRGIGKDIPVDVELRWGEQSERVTWGSIERQQYEQMEALIGGVRFRYPFLARTRYVGGRIGTHGFNLPWSLASWGFQLAVSDARQ
jgi:hypothetical protein